MANTTSALAQSQARWRTERKVLVVIRCTGPSRQEVAISTSRVGGLLNGRRLHPSWTDSPSALRSGAPPEDRTSSLRCPHTPRCVDGKQEVADRLLRRANQTAAPWVPNIRCAQARRR